MASSTGVRDMVEMCRANLGRRARSIGRVLYALWIPGLEIRNKGDKNSVNMMIPRKNKMNMRF